MREAAPRGAGAGGLPPAGGGAGAGRGDGGGGGARGGGSIGGGGGAREAGEGEAAAGGGGGAGAAPPPRWRGRVASRRGVGGVGAGAQLAADRLASAGAVDTRLRGEEAARGFWGRKSSAPRAHRARRARVVGILTNCLVGGTTPSETEPTPFQVLG